LDIEEVARIDACTAPDGGSMITEIGALVGIIKALLEASKAGLDLFGGSSRTRIYRGAENT